jgi:cell division protein FtsW (lipid II flippase)
MRHPGDLTRNPRTVGIICAAAAVALGLAYLAAAVAPTAYLAINTAALLIGLVLLKLERLLRPQLERLPAATLLLIPAVLLATALVGTPVEGASRWVRVAGISLQPSLLLLPLLVIAFARSRNPVTTVAVLLAAVALALQPDRAMAGALMGALTVVALLRPDRFTLAAAAASLAAFIATLLQPDTLAPVPFVEQVIVDAFALHALAGAAVVAGSALLLVPAMLGWRHDPANRPVHAAVGLFWLAAIAASLLGAYPTPLVGYGGSAILGYLLALTLLPSPGGRGEAPAPLAAPASPDSAPKSRHLLQEFRPCL